MSGHLPVAVVDLAAFFGFFPQLLIIALWFLIARKDAQQRKNRPVITDHNGVERQSREQVQATAEAAGLEVWQYIFAQPRDACYGALGLTLGPGVSARLEFKGELREIRRVTVQGLHPDLMLSSGLRAARDRTGDPSFDGQLKLGVSLWKTRGTLGVEARRCLQDLNSMVGSGGSLSVHDGTLTMTLDAKAGWAMCMARLPALVSALRGLYRALQPGAPGERWLMDLALQDPTPGARARAVALLGEVELKGDARQVAEAALNDASAEVRLQAALALRNASMLNEVEIAPLLEAARQDMKRVLAGLEAAGAEIALVALLSAPEGEIVIGAAEALGRIGSVASVEPLRQVVERGVLNNAEKRAARQAIASIQGRLQGAEAGQISVMEAGPEAGALAVAAEAGQLSEAHAGQRRSMNSTHQ